MSEERVLELTDETRLCPNGFIKMSERLARVCMSLEGVPNGCACLMLTDDEGIRQINRDTRGIDSATDVLSFPSVTYKNGHTAGNSEGKLRRAFDPLRGRVFLGDICINVNRAELQAREFGHSVKREMGYLLAHGMFHIMGYDHMLEKDAPAMRRMERRAMREMGLFRPRSASGRHTYKSKRRG